MAERPPPRAAAGDFGKRRALAWATALGAWSVACGFAVFLYLAGSKDHGLSLLAGAVVVAGVVALLTECVKDLVREGRISEHQGVSPPARIVVAAMMMAIFELFVGAWHYLTAEHETAEAGIRDTILGPVLAETAGTTTALVVLVGVWLLVGAVVARALARGVFLDPKPVAADLTRAEAADRSGRGAKAGLVVGAVAPVVLVLGYVLVVRTVGGLYALLFDHDAYASHLRRIDAQGGLLAIVCAPVRWIDAAWSALPWTKLGMLTVVVLKRTWKAIVGGVVVAVTLPPLLGDLGHVASLLGFAALVWALPAAALGALLPYLRRPAAAPRAWGRIALAAATLLGLLAALGQTSAWMLLPAGLLATAGILFQRGARLENWWPLMALATGLLVGGVTLGLQRMTFLGVFTDFLAVNSLPTLDEPEPPAFGLREALSFAGRPRSPEYAAFREEAQRIPGDPPGQREAHALDLIARLTAVIDRPADPNGLERLLHATGVGLDLQLLRGELQAYVADLRKRAEERAALDRARDRWREDGTARDLQVSLSSSVGFWLTLALLAAWSIRRHEEAPSAPYGAETSPPGAA